MIETLTLTEIPGVPRLCRGKVRDVYDLGAELLIVSTDRLSAFDHVLPTPIPDKGRVLNTLSAFWFEWTKNLAPNHVITTDVKAYPSVLRDYSAMLQGRSMLVKKAKRVDVECVVRGYLAGSGWKDYRAKGAICGQALPEGLVDSSKLPVPIFTPTTKAAEGHDMPISLQEMENSIGRELTKKLQDLSLLIYGAAAAYAEKKGLILADTKFEFGLLDGKVIVIDEMLTPDSSRYWDKKAYAPGRPQESFDKQYVRDYLERIGWNKEPPPPPLPADVVAETTKKYREAYRRLVGKEL